MNRKFRSNRDWLLFTTTHSSRVFLDCLNTLGDPQKQHAFLKLYVYLIFAVFHLPARPARISHKIRRGRKVLKDVRPPDACFFRLASPVSKKILLFRLLSRDFTAPELFTITPAYWYPASASRLFAKILTTECQSH